MALRKRLVTAAMLAALAIALVALSGCTKVITDPGGHCGQHRDRIGHRYRAGDSRHRRDVVRRDDHLVQRQDRARRRLQGRRADHRGRQEGRRRREGHPDAERERLPADERPERQAGRHRLHRLALGPGQGARHRQARRRHHGGEQRRRQQHQRSVVHRGRSCAVPTRRRSTRLSPTLARAPRRWPRPPARASAPC